MSKQVIEYDAECGSCEGTGLYVGFAERFGRAVVCRTCKGTGCQHVRIEYDTFKKRKTRPDVVHVLECNPGIMLGDNEQFACGGMPYQDWAAGKPFILGMEMREFVCPAWWCQSAQCRSLNWSDCDCNAFSLCKQFSRKNECWVRFDREAKKTKCDNQ